MRKIKKIIPLLSICIVSCSINKKLPSEKCSLMDVIVKNITNEEHKSELTVVKQYLTWDSSWAFYMPVKYFPKTPKERIEKLSAEHDPYAMLYVFANPTTDSLFSKETQDYMKKQSKLKDDLNIDCGLPLVKFIDRQQATDTFNSEQQTSIYAFYNPVFSKDKKYAIVRMYSNYQYFPSNQINTGILQTFYFKQDKQGKWIEIYKSPKWL